MTKEEAGSGGRTKTDSHQDRPDRLVLTVVPDEWQDLFENVALISFKPVNLLFRTGITIEE